MPVCLRRLMGLKSTPYSSCITLDGIRYRSGWESVSHDFRILVLDLADVQTLVLSFTLLRLVVVGYVLRVVD